MSATKRLVSRAVIVLLMGIAALATEPTSANAAHSALGLCTLCISSHVCSSGGAWTQCASVCPDFNGMAACGWNSEDCRPEDHRVVLVCGSGDQ